MSHDAATSMRESSPGLFALLDIAIAQSGVKGIDSAGLYALSAWSIKQGRRFPWYYMNERSILAAEGGRDAVISTVAGAALALMASGNVPEVLGDNPLASACYQAGKDWRSDLRRQWGDTGTDRSLFQVPETFSDLEAADTYDKTTTIEDWVTMNAVEMAGPSPEFDPDNISDPRLAALWSKLSKKERDLALILADAPNTRRASQAAGITDNAARLRLLRMRRKANAMTSLAEGAAA